MMRTLLLCLLAACAVSAGCRESGQTDADGRPAAGAANTPAVAGAQPTPAATPADASRESKPPTPEEARAALERVYRQTLTVEANRPDALIVGDFNGDGSEDLAVAVKAAAGALAELNGEFPNWIIVDPGRALPFDPDKRVQAAPPSQGPPKVEAGDALLAILHGHGPAGWRSPEATQSYLLKGGAGSGMRAVPARDYPPALKVRRNLNSRSDIISGTLAGADVFLYWSRGKYIRQQR
jgi:hypothetical protein